MVELTLGLIFLVTCAFTAVNHLIIAHAVGLFKKLAAGTATMADLTQRVGSSRRRQGIQL